jgi:hypothetical protein
MTSRSILKTGDPSSVQLLYRTGPSEKHHTALTCAGILFLTSGLLCVSDKVMASTFVEVYENRLVYNYPITCCGTIFDYVGTVYFDSDSIQYTAVAGCCTPCCTHNSITFDCFQLW